ncbi:MAG TPA: PDZ domain-containing protein [Planctomycetes bacterium]|nr:PDZ domain-containing protein [Planctomycetota bacterium]
MKLSTQRLLVWTANFALLAGLGVFVWLMYQNSGPARRAEKKKVFRQLIQRLNDETRPKRGDREGPRPAALLKTVFDPNFHYEGYIPPKKPVEAPTDPGEETSPKLDTLIDVAMLLAPSSGGVGSDDVVGALVKIKSKPTTKNLFWYGIGDVIGITKNDDRDDEDPVLKKWKGARVVDVKPEGIVCEWADQGRVEIRIPIMEEPEGLEMTMSDGTVRGRLGVKGGARSGGAPALDGDVSDASGPIFKSVREQRNLTMVQLTPGGLATINAEGERLLDNVKFEKVDGPKGKKALKVSNIPARLQGAGLKDGDVVIRVDSQAVDSKEALVNYVKRTYRSKSNYAVTVLRNGQTRIIRVSVPRNARGLRTPNVRFGSGRR